MSTEPDLFGDAVGERLATGAPLAARMRPGTLDEVVANPHPFIRNFFMGERGRRALEAVQAVNAIMAMT